MKSNPETPENTPPATPTPPSSGTPHMGKNQPGPLGNGAQTPESAKAKQRKRKKVDIYIDMHISILIVSRNVLLCQSTQSQ